MTALREAHAWLGRHYVWVAAALGASIFVGLFFRTHHLGVSAALSLYCFGLMALPYSDKGGRNSLVEVCLGVIVLTWVPVAVMFAVVYWTKVVMYVFTGTIQ